MKKILMLGGSNCQKNAILRGKSRGFEIVLADYLKDPVGAKFADKHVQVSTFDHEACIQAARNQQVDGVMTMGTDQPVLTVAKVAEALDLPRLIDVNQAMGLTNKKYMKKVFSASGIPTVPYEIVDQNTKFDQLSRFKGAVVLKPLDAQGQRGVFKLADLKDAKMYLEKTLSFSRLKEALLETYYESDEITVSGWVKDGILHILTVTDRILLADPVNIGICTSHRFPSVHMDKFQDIKKISGQIVDAFKIVNGPIYIQMLIGAEGILVNEVAGRIGGAFEDVIIPAITGFDILDALIDSALGQPVDMEVLKGYECSESKIQASVQLMFAHPGEISAITPEEDLFRIEDVVDIGYNYKIGDFIGVTEDATGRFGHCVLISEGGTLETSIRKFKDTFQILDGKGNNLFRVIEE